MEIPSDTAYNRFRELFMIVWLLRQLLFIPLHVIDGAPLFLHELPTAIVMQ
jgi:hypothetical protein